MDKLIQYTYKALCLTKNANTENEKNDVETAEGISYVSMERINIIAEIVGATESAIMVNGSLIVRNA